ncbi:MAG: FHA domain-containing protein [Nannocystaceae bacterium]
MARLRETTTGRRVVLPARCLVGRVPTADLLLQESVVSGEHALIQWTGGHWELRDLGSRNGTHVDQHPLAAGETVALALGHRLRFGRRAVEWEVEAIDEPRPMARALASEALIVADGGYLSLPEGDEVQFSVYQDPSGAWVVEAGGELRSIDDRSLLVTEDGARWRIYLPTALVRTVSGHEVPVMIAQLRLCFAVSRDEEHVELAAIAGDRRLDLQARAHHYPLLLLARRRLDDRARGLSEAEAGWIPQTEWARMLKMDDNHLNICVHRARTQLSRLGVVDAASLVERRSGSRQVRIGVRALEIGPIVDDPGAPPSPRGARRARVR